MADNYINKLKTLSGTTLTEFDIYAPAGATSADKVNSVTNAYSATLASKATVAGSAKGINSTYKITLGGDVSGDDLVGTAISANKTINTRITNVPWKAISATNASGSKSDITYDSTAWSSTNTRFLTPKVVSDYVESQVSAVAEDAGLYQAKGNIAFSGLSATSTHHNGYVYNVTTSGTIPTTSGYNGQTFEVQPGDNLVWIKDPTKPGWDKLADPFAVAKSTLEPYSAASAAIGHFNDTYNTVTNNSAGWNNTAHNVFANVNTVAGTVTASSYNSVFNLSGINVSAGGTSPTATLGLSNISAFKTFKVTNAGGTTANVNAAAFSDTITFAAGGAIQLSPTVDENGNPTITINKTDTTAAKATTAANGLVQLSYFKEVDTTNHVGTLVVQGNMSATNLA